MDIRKLRSSFLPAFVSHIRFSPCEAPMIQRDECRPARRIFFKINSIPHGALGSPQPQSKPRGTQNHRRDLHHDKEQSPDVPAYYIHRNAYTTLLGSVPHRAASHMDRQKVENPLSLDLYSTSNTRFYPSTPPLLSFFLFIHRIIGIVFLLSRIRGSHCQVLFAWRRPVDQLAALIFLGPKLLRATASHGFLRYADLGR